MRFVPDTWFDALMRPFLMVDPVNGMYVEIAAPDWRFAACVLLLVAALVGRRGLGWLQPNQRAAFLGLALCFYLWTFVSGNGRYFIWGLLLVGPLLVVAARGLRVSRFMRNSVVIGVLALQFVAIWLNFQPNMWTLRPWREGPGLALQPTPLQARPAVFLTIGAISYSALVPQLHPQSRWANISGQFENRPGVREYPALLSLLRSELPHYVVVRANSMVLDEAFQPIPKARQSIAGVLSRHNIDFATPGCDYVRSADAQKALDRGAPKESDEGFWFCPVIWNGPVDAGQALAPVAPEFDSVFAQIEGRCPQMFPPGYAKTIAVDGAYKRGYAISDANLFIDLSGVVYVKHLRALNPTVLGPAEQVRRGQFTLDCARIEGRYLPPWARP